MASSQFTLLGRLLLIAAFICAAFSFVFVSKSISGENQESGLSGQRETPESQRRDDHSGDLEQRSDGIRSIALADAHRELVLSNALADAESKLEIRSHSLADAQKELSNALNKLAGCQEEVKKLSEEVKDMNSLAQQHAELRQQLAAMSGSRPAGSSSSSSSAESSFFVHCHNFPIYEGSCWVNKTLYSCHSVPGRVVSDEFSPNPTPWCLGGAHSWMTCDRGRFLCEHAMSVPGRAISGAAAGGEGAQCGVPTRDVSVGSVLVLNLPWSTERFRRVSEQLTKIGITRYHKVEAVSLAQVSDLDARDLQRIMGDFFSESFQFRGGKGLVKQGDMSVALSHLKAWQQIANTSSLCPSSSSSSSPAAENSECWGFVVEDDVLFDLPPHLLQPSPAPPALRLPALPADADLVIFHPSRLSHTDSGCDGYHTVQDGAGLIGYALSSRGASKLIRWLRYFKLTLPIDLQIHKVLDLGIYCSASEWVKHDDRLASDRVKVNGPAE